MICVEGQSRKARFLYKVKTKNQTKKWVGGGVETDGGGREWKSGGCSPDVWLG